MKRRAFTLLEVLLSLVLLGSLTVASVSWTTRVLAVQQDQTTQHRASETRGRIRRSIQIDLTNEDTRLPVSVGREHRVWIERASLHVLTRDRGAVEVSYQLDEAGALIRSVQPLAVPAEGHAEPVAGGIRSIAWSFDIEENRPYAFVVADWEDDAGGQHEIRFDVTRGWLP